MPRCSCSTPGRKPGTSTKREQRNVERIAEANETRALSDASISSAPGHHVGLVGDDAYGPALQAGRTRSRCSARTRAGSPENPDGPRSAQSRRARRRRSWIGGNQLFISGSDFDAASCNGRRGGSSRLFEGIKLSSRRQSASPRHRFARSGAPRRSCSSALAARPAPPRSPLRR